MQTRRAVVVMSLAAALVFLPACVELTDQRITWFYDAARDTLRILIFYDGIHDCRAKNADGAEQIRKFVRNGDVMFLDWYGHVDMEETHRHLEDPDPLKRAVARLATTVETRPLGHFREPDGRVGAAQLVVIRRAREFVGKVNELISRSILAEASAKEEGLERTMARVREAAKNGHPWLAIEGHAISLTLPVHPGEWAARKWRSLREALDAFAEVVRMDTKHHDGGETVRRILQSLTSLPLSYLDHGNQVTFVLGRPDRPTTWRLPLREDYEPSLEPVVAATVKTDLDRALARALLDPAAPSALRSTILAWGPPEERVRALLGVLEHGDPPQQEAARKQLEAWASRWNREAGVPAAPAPAGGAAGRIATWKRWYRAMRRFPEGPEDEDARTADRSDAE